MSSERKIRNSFEEIKRRPWSKQILPKKKLKNFDSEKTEYFDSAEKKLMVVGSKLDIFGTAHQFKDPKIFADTEIRSRKM